MKSTSIWSLWSAAAVSAEDHLESSSVWLLRMPTSPALAVESSLVALRACSLILGTAVHLERTARPMKQRVRMVAFIVFWGVKACWNAFFVTDWLIQQLVRQLLYRLDSVRKWSRHSIIPAKDSLDMHFLIGFTHQPKWKLRNKPLHQVKTQPMKSSLSAKFLYYTKILLASPDCKVAINSQPPLGGGCFLVHIIVMVILLWQILGYMYICA